LLLPAWIIPGMLMSFASAAPCGKSSQLRCARL
jgi:hypothetical protein